MSNHDVILLAPNQYAWSTDESSTDLALEFNAAANNSRQHDIANPHPYSIISIEADNGIRTITELGNNTVRPELATGAKLKPTMERTGTTKPLSTSEPYAASPVRAEDYIREIRERRPSALILATSRSGHDGVSNPEIARDLIAHGVDLLIAFSVDAKESITFIRNRLVITSSSRGNQRDEAEAKPASPSLRINSKSDWIHYSPDPGMQGNSIEHFMSYYNSLAISARDPKRFLEVATPRYNTKRGYISFLTSNRGHLPPKTRPPVKRYPALWEPSESAPADFSFDPAFGLNSQLIERSLKQRGARTHRLGRTFLTADYEGIPLAYRVTSSHQTSIPAARAAARKDLTRNLLQRINLPVAFGQHFSSVDDLPEGITLLETVPQTVVKPTDGNKGRGVTVGVETAEQMTEAWHSAFRHSRAGILVEEQFHGTEARFIVIGGECIGVAGRIPPTIYGDGSRTIRELILDKNHLRSQNPHLYDRPILLNQHRLHRISEHGYTLMSVLPEGTSYIIDQKAGFSTGADSIDITDDIHPSFLAAASRATSVFQGLDIAGIDILARDFSKPASNGNYIICEVNTQPGIGAHHFPAIGKARNVAGAIVDFNVAKSVGSKAPAIKARRRRRIAAMSSTLGHNPSALLLAQEMTRRGFVVDWFSESYLVARKKNFLTSFWRSTTDRTGIASLGAISDPRIGLELLERADVPQSPGRVFRKDSDPNKVFAFAVRYRRVFIRRTIADGETVETTDRSSFERIWAEATSERARSVSVERSPRGRVFQFLIASGQVLSVIRTRRDGGTVGAVSGMHPSYLTTAVRAFDALPGLDLCEVSLAIRDYSAPASRNNHVVKGVRPVPDLVSYQQPSVGQGMDVARAIVDLHLGCPSSAVQVHPVEEDRLSRKNALERKFRRP